MMFFFTPKSNRATLNRASEFSGNTSYASVVATFDDNSSPFISGIVANWALSSSIFKFSEEIIAFIAPLLRICRTNARVSTSAMPTLFCDSNNSCKDEYPEGLEKPLENFFVIRPEIIT